MATSSLRLLIGDDRPLISEGLKAALQREKGVVVAGLASDVRALAALCGRHRPDVVIVSHQLPPRGGAAAIAELLSRFPVLRTILLAGETGSEDVYRAIRAGARGCLLRDTSLRACVRILRSVHAGRLEIRGSLAEGLAHRMNSRDLTAKEHEVLRRMAAGRSNKEIGSDLGIVEGTVKIHVRKILKKLDARSRLQAVTRALRQGLVTDYSFRDRPDYAQ
jgi:two-component system NarL family response regulator